MWPIMTTSAFGMGPSKKLPGGEADAAAEAIFGDVLLEDRADFGEVEADAGEVRIGERDLSDQVALRGADVDGGLVVSPRELLGDGHVGAVADAGHGFEEVAQSLRVRVERGEETGAAAADFVLRLAGAQGGGEVAPEGVQALVGHLQHAADVGRLALVEEEIGLGRVVVDAVAALEEPEGDERVEEVARGARMQAEAGGEFGERLGVFGEFGEDFHLDGAEQSLRGPEAEADLQNLVWPWFAHDGNILN